MCIIIAAKTGIELEKEILDRCATNNPQGAGVSWFEDGKARIFKSMNPVDVTARVLALGTEFDRVVHYRIASVGGATKELLHPFPCTRSVRHTDVEAASTLCHNGTWHNWRELALEAILRRQELKPPAGPWSDSRCMAFLTAVLGKEWLAFLPDSQKVAVLDARGITLYGHFTKHKGAHYSNHGFEPPRVTTWNAGQQAYGRVIEQTGWRYCRWAQCLNAPDRPSQYCREHQTDAQRKADPSGKLAMSAKRNDDDVFLPELGHWCE